MQDAERLRAQLDGLRLARDLVRELLGAGAGDPAQDLSERRLVGTAERREHGRAELRLGLEGVQRHLEGLAPDVRVALVHRGVEELRERRRVAADRRGERAAHRDGRMALQGRHRDHEALGHRRAGRGGTPAFRPGRRRRLLSLVRLLHAAEELDRAQAVGLRIAEHEVLVAEQTMDRLGQRDIVEGRRDVVQVARRAPDLRAGRAGDLVEHVLDGNLLEANGETVVAVPDDGGRGVLGMDAGRPAEGQQERGHMPCPAHLDGG
jgi:hypothetical protein